MEPNEIVRALRCTKNENENCTTCKYAVPCKRTMLGGGWFDYCNSEALESDAADCIERLQAELEASKRMEMAAIAILNSIDWVGSGAKGRIEDAIGILRGPEQEGE